MASPDRAAARALPRRGITDHILFGMGVFVFTEVMVFAAFLSAYLIVRNAAVPGTWPPADQPRLPFERTAWNTLALLASGALVAYSNRAYRLRGPVGLKPPLTLGLALGALFVLLQGVEWFAMLRQGLTISSSQVGGFFYLIVGFHALHAVCALGVLAWCWSGLMRQRFSVARYRAAQLFWFFVVLVWPVLWLVVYR